MKLPKLFSAVFLSMLFLHLSAQKKNTSVDRPKLVVGIMIDQMRWDYLYRYHDNYDSSGFRRILRHGFSCENTMIPYAQTVTAPGHASVYTGSTPAFHGIIGNDWYDKEKQRVVYCTEDETVKIIGGTAKSEPMSPRNLWSNTITDELRLATNFRSKVIGVAIKDRGSILPSGHSANAAYWYDDKNGNFVSSTYYMPQLPQWVDQFNNRKLVDSFYRLNWHLAAPLSAYQQSSADEKSYETKLANQTNASFPYELSGEAGKNYNLIRATPYGNSFTLMFAKAAVDAERLGNNGTTDFLNISLSSTDVIGHQFGPNSVEIEDTYRRFDKDLGDFLAYLDRKVGKGNYLLFITADHAAAHIPGFLNENKMPGAAVTNHLGALNNALKEKYGIANLLTASHVYQYYINEKAVTENKINKNELKEFVIDWLNKKDEVYLAFANSELSGTNLPQEIKENFYKGFNPKLSGDIQVILKPASFYGNATGTNHGLWYPYDAHIPLLFYGWQIKPGQTHREVYMTDIAPTIAALLKIQMPNACIGKPIVEVVK